MAKVDHISSRTASRKLVRAITHLTIAGQQLSAASHASPDHYHQSKFRNLAEGLREFSLPLSRIASILERGGEL